MLGMPAPTVCTAGTINTSRTVACAADTEGTEADVCAAPVAASLTLGTDASLTMATGSVVSGRDVAKLVFFDSAGIFVVPT
ncbi:hypothetical protein DPMN_031125 [Dreissena polymorpha]|uniref:Uncharacterized protein n=1 Tax=Dreissena polymorpha TaxID=45954 RepID=A0A9D4RH10_DREPO|nr:hypothetical protein DPMN_031125 [Dreissena polymorpha]